MRKSFSHIYFCPDHYTEIKNYDLALKDDFKDWVCHHIKGEEFTKEWLIQNNLYFNRTDPHEFVFLPAKYGISKRRNLHLYNTEAYFYRTHGYCSWEC